MSYTRKSIPKPSGGAGAPSPKNPKVTLIYTDDVLATPTRGVDGVTEEGNYVVNAGAKMIYIYATPSSLKSGFTIEGDEDKESIKKTFEGSHPGSEKELAAFIQDSLGKGFIIIYGAGCGEATGRTMGSVCNPMKFTGEFKDDKDGAETILKFAQTINDRLVPGYYDGEITYAENANAASADVDMLKATGAVYQLPAHDTTDVITAASIDLDHGTVVSLIGKGGANPATLESGPQGAVTVILANDTTWVALDKAVINLKVFKAGATTYLIEQSRG